MGSSPIVGERLRSLVDERRSSEPGDVGSNPAEDACFAPRVCVHILFENIKIQNESDQLESNQRHKMPKMLVLHFVFVCTWLV